MKLKHRHLVILAITVIAVFYVDGYRALAVLFALVIVDWTEFLFKPWRDEFVRLRYWADHTKTITVRKRGGVHVDDVIAELEHDAGHWGCGRTSPEAVGQLVVCSPEQFHVVIKPQS